MVRGLLAAGARRRASARAPPRDARRLAADWPPTRRGTQSASAVTRRRTSRHPRGAVKTTWPGSLSKKAMPPTEPRRLKPPVSSSSPPISPELADNAVHAGHRHNPAPHNGVAAADLVPTSGATALIAHNEMVTHSVAGGLARQGRNVPGEFNLTTGGEQA